MKTNVLLTYIFICGIIPTAMGQVTYTYPGLPINVVFDGDLIEADYWDTIPRILSASLGFCDIVGIDATAINQNTVMQAGGAWLSDVTCGTDDRNYTSTSLKSSIQNGYIVQNEPWILKDSAIGLDGLPVVFSWPVLTNTIDVTDFRLILNTGDTVIAYAAGSLPNFENNERNCVVLFGEFANRRPSNDPLARFPVKCEIVDDGTPLMLAGHNNQVVSAVGLSWETTTNPYDPNNGPRLVGAKLNRTGSQSLGEATNNLLLNNFIGLFPNDEFALYGGGDFRLRTLTSGGFSPDGVRGVKPTDYERFFRIHAIAPDGSTMLLESTDTVYNVQGGTLKILGLSDLGMNSSTYDDCYDEDLENYIDIIIEGDEAAARNITHVEIPSLAGGYDAFYNPGGPGSTPFPGVIYTQPGPPDLEPVIMALDNPMRVNAANLTSTSNIIDDLDNEKLIVYPNPATNEINIITADNFNGHFEIYNMIGVLILQSKRNTINVSHLNQGTYILLKRSSDGVLTTTMFVKN